MYGSGNQPVIVLKEGTERSKDKEAQFNNISAAKAVADAVRSTLGPKGMDKMLVNTIGDVVITNDGVTILKEIDVQHPAAKMVVEVAKTQDAECGDGTTTSVVLAGELLKQSETLIDANVHPTVITNGFKMAADKAVEILNEIAIDAKSDEVLKNVASTALVGKSVGDEEEALADIVVKACKSVEEDGKVDTKNIRIQKKVGGVIGDTYLVQGVVIDKEKVHSRMPSHVEDAKIALFSCPLEVKKTEFDAQIQITDPTMMSSFLDEEEKSMKAMVEKIKEVGANVVFCQKGVDELVQHYLSKAGILAYRRLKESDLEAIAKATGANIVGNVQEMTAEDLGTAGAVDEKQVGEDGMAFITGCKNPKAITIFVRGGTEHVLEERLHPRRRCRHRGRKGRRRCRSPRDRARAQAGRLRRIRWRTRAARHREVRQGHGDHPLDPRRERRYRPHRQHHQAEERPREEGERRRLRRSRPRQRRRRRHEGQERPRAPQGQGPGHQLRPGGRQYDPKDRRRHRVPQGPSGASAGSRRNARNVIP